MTISTAFRAGVEAGAELSIACYSCNHTLTDLLLRGDHLDEVWRESERCLDFLRKAKFRDGIDTIVSQQRFIENMRGQTASFSTFSDTDFDETAFEAQLTEDRITTMIVWYWILKLQARFISGDYEAAIAAARKAEALSGPRTLISSYSITTTIARSLSRRSTRPIGHTSGAST